MKSFIIKLNVFLPRQIIPAQHTPDQTAQHSLEFVAEKNKKKSLYRQVRMRTVH